MSQQGNPLSLGDCRNPDGSWSGVKTLAKLSGRSEAEVLSIWERTSLLVNECNMNIKDAAKVAVQEHDTKKLP